MMSLKEEKDMNPYLCTLLGTSVAFLATTLGSAMVFLLKKENEKMNILSLGFASGIMMAAAVWSLLIPSIEMANQSVIPATVGFIIGGAFLYSLDHLVPHLHAHEQTPEGPKSHIAKSTMMCLAVTLHNIPEGMALGLAFALGSQGNANFTLAGAMALTIGIALQNLPEGAAISLPLFQKGTGRVKSFVLGTLSGIVEPIGGMLTVMLVGTIEPLLPYFLSFAAGAMIYVVVEELIPESQGGHHGHLGVVSFMVGFLTMMILDVVLG